MTADADVSKGQTYMSNNGEFQTLQTLTKQSMTDLAHVSGQHHSNVIKFLLLNNYWEYILNINHFKFGYLQYKPHMIHGYN